MIPLIIEKFRYSNLEKSISKIKIIIVTVVAQKEVIPSPQNKIPANKNIKKNMQEIETKTFLNSLLCNGAMWL